MAPVFNKLKTADANDGTKEKEGVWTEYTPDGDSFFRIKLAFAGGANERYLKRAEEVARPYRRSGVDIATIVVEKQREISGTLFAETIVTDWNAEDFEAPFTIENAKEAFKVSPGLLSFCIQEANRQAAYRKTQVEAESGN